MDQQPEAVIRIVVVEDEALYRNMLVSLLNHEPQVRVVGAFESAFSALAQIPQLDFDVAVLDISLGRGMNGIQLGLQLRAQRPRLGILLLSSTFRPSLLRSIPDSSLSGWSYLHKKSVQRIGTLVRAIRKTAGGSMVLDSSLTSRASHQTLAVVPLVLRQLAILELIAQGYSDDEIAVASGLSAAAVATQTQDIYDTLGIDSTSPDAQPRVKAVLYYLKQVAMDP